MNMFLNLYFTLVLSLQCVWQIIQYWLLLLLCEDTSNCILLDILNKRCVVLPQSVPFFFFFFLGQVDMANFIYFKWLLTH